MEYAFTQGVSGWRAVFGKTEEDAQRLLPQVALAVQSFAEFLGIDSAVILVGMDTRPGGALIAAAAVQTLLSCSCIVRFAGVLSAPEIMAASSTLDGFVFVTASHNPVEHNGLKFGRHGAVLSREENEKLSAIYKAKCDAPDATEKAAKALSSYSHTELSVVYRGQEDVKRKTLAKYKDFANGIIGDVSYGEEGFCVLADFNGGARAASIDKEFFAEHGVTLIAMNDGTGGALSPVHGIVPEGENLIPLAKEMERLHETGEGEPIIGYMTDCDGDRGNIVYWDDSDKKAHILQAQEVFALAVMHYLKAAKGEKKAVAVNCATSERIDAAAEKEGARVFRCEVGEANVAGAAEEARAQGFSVPIAGEGSNGGLIAHPSKVRDPLMTVFAMLALLREEGSIKAALESIPRYTTTGATEGRAQMKVKANKEKLKAVFEKGWKSKKASLKKKYGIASYDAAFANGIHERALAQGASENWDNGTGSLKVRFMDKDGVRVAFLWMRQSGTEDTLRVMCDVKGGNTAEEEELLKWWRAMIEEASK